MSRRKTRPVKLSPAQIKEALRRYDAGESFAEMAPEYGVHRMRLYRYFRSARPEGDRRREDWHWRSQREIIRRHWITAAQAAELLGIDRRSVCDLCRRGRLPGAFRLGEGATAVWLIPRAAITARLRKYPPTQKASNDADE